MYLRNAARKDRGMNNLPVNGITDLSHLIDEKVRKDLWKLISGVDRRQRTGVDVHLPNRLVLSLYSSLTAELVETLKL